MVSLLSLLYICHGVVATGTSLRAYLLTDVGKFLAENKIEKGQSIDMIVKLYDFIPKRGFNLCGEQSIQLQS